MKSLKMGMLSAGVHRYGRGSVRLLATGGRIALSRRRRGYGGRHLSLPAARAHWEKMLDDA